MLYADTELVPVSASCVTMESVVFKEEEGEEEESCGGRELNSDLHDIASGGFESAVQDLWERRQRKLPQFWDSRKGGGGGVSEGDIVREETEVSSDDRTSTAEEKMYIVLQQRKEGEREEEVDEGELSDTNSIEKVETMRDWSDYGWLTCDPFCVCDAEQCCR